MIVPFLLSVLAVPPVPMGPPLASVAWVRAENDGAGTGFVVDVEKKLLITCRHIAADRKVVDVYFPWRQDGELVSERAVYLRNRLRLRELGMLVTGKVLKTSDAHDLALVELESVPIGTKAVTFAAFAPSPGDPLQAIGNRLDLETVWNITAGPARTSGKLTDGYFWRGKKLAVNAEILLGQLPTEEGDSGGPVFDIRGELVGMASALRRQCPLAAVCIGASEIWQFAGIPQPVAKEKPKPSEIADALTRATVWIRPTATDMHLAGTLIEPNLVLTCGRKFTPGDRVGIAFPHRDGDKWNGDRTPYRDALGTQLRGGWRSATVIAHDRDRELTLLRLDSPVEFMRPVTFATKLPALGEGVHAMSHPGGLEFAWVYAGGPVRQRGQLTVTLGENAKRATVLVCQLAAQGGSPGGPVMNDRGELVGILSARESAQLVGYAVATEEIVAFLDVALSDRPAKTLAGLLARIEELPARFATATALGYAQSAEAHRLKSRFDEAKQDCDNALSLDTSCVPARVCRARILEAMSKPADALAELDAAVEKGSFNRSVLFLRSEWASDAKDWRKARADLERVLDVNPADADARQRLVGVLVELGDEAKAAIAVVDTLRTDPKRLAGVAADLLTQADSLTKKYPDAPSIPAGWLLKATTVAKRPEFAEMLKRVARAKDDAERLALLRDGLKKVK
ncbi:MAG: trypsin-like peptidase domain-containing protein [Planctomycetes bacterium]|nr:trypsin-like peptidase domain-containing protein [Planctomycetota bacterium]